MRFPVSGLRWCGFLAGVLLVSMEAAGVDWPTYRCDVQRGGATDEGLELPLGEVWRHVAEQGPCPAWPGPAKRDFGHAIARLRPSVAFDRAFHVAVVGGRAYYGSSADDAVHCIDVADGGELWRFYTEGPVRLAPSVSGGKVYVGSDDGWVYCLDAVDGGLVWRYRAGPGGERILGNGRMVSVWPVRSGVVVDEGVAYFAAGLFPLEGVFLCAVDAGTGEELWKESIGVSAQGYLLASPARLFVPTGRTAPSAFGRDDGGRVVGLKGFHKRDVGGCFAVLLEDALVHGPSESGNVHMSDVASQEKIVSAPGVGLVVQEGVAYVLEEDGLYALDRGRYQALSKEITKIVQVRADERDAADEARLEDLLGQRKGCEQWRVPRGGGYALVMAGDTLFVGGDGEVTAHSGSTGAAVWTGQVDGRAYGLAVAGGALFVSTDTGALHCFRAGGSVVTAGVSDGVAAYPADALGERYAATAERIVADTGIRKGYCLVLDAGDGRLAYELARRTELTIVAVEADAGKVARARAALGRAGLCGRRVAVHQLAGEALPYPDGFANLVVSGRVGALPGMGAEVLRVLRPFGGVVHVGQPEGAGGELEADDLAAWRESLGPAGGADAGFAWELVSDGGVWGCLRRGAVAGAGAWTHQYGDAGNTACSGDRLANGPMGVQWFGAPGPREMIDRHIRTVAPLSKDGRLFVPGDNRIFAVDAYNGSALWSVDLPYARRVAIHLDSGSMALGGERLYVVAGERCLALDVGSGQTVRRFETPQHLPGELGHWGYLAVSGNRIVGSGNRQDATRSRVGHIADRESRYGDPKTSVTSRYLFALDRETGREVWHYRGGVIWNPCIALGDGRVYFLESRDAGAMERLDMRMKPGDLTGNGACFLVALDLGSGEKLWERAVDVGMCEYVVYLSYADETLLVSGSGLKAGDENVWYYVYGFSAEDGAALWAGNHRNNKKGTIDHGKEVHHPAIAGGVVYAEPVAYALRTGDRIEGLEFPRGGHSCGTISASSASLFYRGNNPQVFDIASRTRTALNNVTRPGCWINMIPAGGLVLLPEASSGCTCVYSLQTSMAFAPRLGR